MLSCEHHDYVEIVCTFKYPIKLMMKSGLIIECIAQDTLLNENRTECIKVKIKDEECLVALDDIQVMEVSVDNPYFKSVSFC